MCLGSIGRLTRVWDEGGIAMGMVDMGTREEVTCLMYLTDVSVGAYLLVHMGFAIEELDAERAAEATALRAGEADDVFIAPPPVADRLTR